MIEIKEFKEEHVEDAAGLFVESYENQRQIVPLIPERKDLYEEVSNALRKNSENPGVAAFQDDELVGYIIENARADNFMSKSTAFSLGLYSHCSVEDSKEMIYQRMYKEISDVWVKEGYHTHIFSIWAQDEDLSFNFFRLGFGMTHFELLRDLLDIDVKTSEISYRKLESIEPIKEIDKEHHEFYPSAPLFWLPPDDYTYEEEIDGEIIAAFDDDKPVGYIHLKKNEAETWLMTDEETCRVKGAYTDPKYRSRGVGKGLLQEGVEWAREEGLKRLYVEGESANIYGGNFWIKHFTPVVYTVRRCIDERV
ncbi:MAG: GNAT family N-acetyltransferase [Thermoplasmatota archaeon]